MADSVIESVRAVAIPKLRTLAVDTRIRFLSDVENFIDGTKAGRIAPLLDQAAEFRLLGITAKTAKEAREWADAAETVIRRIKTIAFAEGVVASEEWASFLSATWASVTSTMVEVGKGVVTAVAGGLVSGAISGLTGGGSGGGLADVASNLFSDG